MIRVAALAESPFHGVTGLDGTFILKGLPPGEYTIEAWTATYGAEEQKVSVRPDESTTVYFDFKGN